MFRRINGASPTPPQTLLESPQISRFKQHGPTGGTQPLDERLRSHPLSSVPRAKKQPRRRSSVGTAPGPRFAPRISIFTPSSRTTIPPLCLSCQDVAPTSVGIPTSAYRAENEIRDDGTQKEEKTFVHVPSSIEAFEAEEIGVEHLLRDVKDNTVSTLATQVSEKISSLDGLEKRLREVKRYMDLVVDGTLPVNHEILGHLQDAFNLLPNLNLEDYVKAFAVKTNDMMLVMYLSSLIRSVVALHDLINNKAANKEKEREMDAAAAIAARPKKEGKEGPESGKEEDDTAGAKK